MIHFSVSLTSTEISSSGSDC